MQFNEATHEYTKQGTSYISVTQLLKKYGLSTNYANIPASILNNAATKGKAVHKALELYIGGDTSMVGLLEEVSLFDNYVRVKNIDLTTAKSEEIVYNDQYKIAGTLDFQYYDVDNNNILEDVISDFKNTSTLHYDSVSWQLSLYNFIKCDGDIIKYYFKKLRCFHFNSGKLHVREIATIDYDTVVALLEANLRGDTVFNYTKPNKIISKSEELLVSQVLSELNQHKAMVKKLDTELDKVLNKIKENMVNNQDYTFKSPDITIKYTFPQNRTTLDTQKVRKYLETQGEQVNNFMRVTTTKDGIRATLNTTTSTLDDDD